MLNIKDLITLDDNNRYLVTNKALLDGLTYYFLVDIKNNTNIKFCYENKIGDKLELTEVDDDNLITKLILLFAKNILDAKKEG